MKKQNEEDKKGTASEKIKMSNVQEKISTYQLPITKKSTVIVNI